MAEAVDTSDSEAFPYELCLDCQQRLHAHALRPLEYFNLTAIHGHKFLLHDDFYEENGEATQPVQAVEVPDTLRFPVFEEIKNDLEKLTDWAVVKWRLDGESITALGKFGKQALLESLKRRTRSNRTVAARMYEIAAAVLGLYAEEWILDEWENRDGDMVLFAQSLAKCTRTGFDLYLAGLDGCSNFKEINEMVAGLIWFQNRESLQWIEENAHRIEIPTNNWSVVVAASEFDWQTCREWLQRGRILSLIALDALVHCAVDGSTENGVFWLQEHPQKLHRPDDIEVMSQVLHDYVESDNVPRTRRCNEIIQRSWNKIIAEKEKKNE